MPNANTPAPATAAAPRSRPRLGRPRLLIVGCGAIGGEIVSRLRGRYRVFGTVAHEEARSRVRALGAIPLLADLDKPRPASRLARLARCVVVLMPPSAEGAQDQRMRRLLAALAAPGRRNSGVAAMVYVSTTGVYGDRQGQWTDESTPPSPTHERAVRRLDAEWHARRSRWHAAVLRAPGIYGPRRLPLERLKTGLPVARAPDDVVTNHIHEADLARAVLAALARAGSTRVYNAVDGTQLTLGEYLDRVADHAALPRPPRASLEDVRRAVGPMRYSFMSESRRLRNERLLRELRLRLLYPDVEAGLAAMKFGNSQNAGKQ